MINRRIKVLTLMGFVPMLLMAHAGHTHAMEGSSYWMHIFLTALPYLLAALVLTILAVAVNKRRRTKATEVSTENEQA